jgi:hypothetical protein
MTILRRWRCLGTAALGGALIALTGCQTWLGGLTLPTGHYLDGHAPQYIPDSPAFPLTNELADQEATYAARPGLAAPLPVPGGPVGAPPGFGGAPMPPPPPRPAIP